MAVTASVTNYNKKPMPAHGDAGEMQVLYWSIALATTDLQDGDQWNLGYLPPNARVHGGWIKATDMDSGTALTINVGDETTEDVFWAASTIGQAGGSLEVMAATGLGYLTTAKTLVLGAPGTSAGTAVAGTFSGAIFYVVIDSATS
jgi:hypothetical protein